MAKIIITYEKPFLNDNLPTQIYEYLKEQGIEGAIEYNSSHAFRRNITKVEYFYPDGVIFPSRSKLETVLMKNGAKPGEIKIFGNHE